MGGCKTDRFRACAHARRAGGLAAVALAGAGCGWEISSGSDREAVTTTVIAAAPSVHAIAVVLDGHDGTSVTGGLSMHFERDEAPPSGLVVVRLHCDDVPGGDDEPIDLDANVRSDTPSEAAFSQPIDLGFSAAVPTSFACDFTIEAPDLASPYTFTWVAYARGEWNGDDDDASMVLAVSAAE